MHYVLCTMHYALFTMHYALCITMHYALCITIYYTLCIAIHYTLCITMHYALCTTMHYALLCTMHYYALCTMHYYALCITRPVQQAVPGRLGPILRGLNGSTCWAVPAHLKDGPSRAGPWTPTDWPGMAHKPGGLAVPASRAGGPCRLAVPAGRANGAVPTGRTGGLAHIKFCFVIKSIFFKKIIYNLWKC